MATIGAHYFRVCTRGAERAGVSRVALLSAARLTAAEIDQPGWRGSVESMSLLVRAICAALGDEHMGYTDRPVRLGAFAMMTEVAMRADTVLGGLKKAIAFCRLISDAIDTRLDPHADEVTLTVAFRRPELDPDHYFLEFWMIVWHRFACWLAGETVPLSLVELTYSRPRTYLEEFKHLFPTKRSFGEPACRLHFDRIPLLTAIVPTEAERREMVARAPLDFMTIPASDRSIGRRVRRLLAPQAGAAFEPVGLAEVAAALAIHPTALARHLRREGTSLTRIVETIRRDRAIARLAHGGWTVEAIAADLGYAEARSFTRAFREWTGMSPLRYRRTIAEAGRESPVPAV